MRLVVTNQRNYLKEKYTKANAWRVVRVFLRGLKVIGIVFLVLIGLVLLPLIIGLITDLAVTPEWVKAQSASLTYFANLKDYRFRSPSLEFVSLDSNAWFYYQKAGDMVHNIPKEDRDVIDSYKSEVDSLAFSKAESVIKKYDKVVALFDSGASCGYCAIPLEYEKISDKSINSVFRQVNLSKLFLIKGRLELIHGNPHNAAEIYAKLTKMGSDVAGGGVDLTNSSIGTWISNRALHQIKLDLNDFDLSSTSFLEGVIDSIEVHRPFLYPAMKSKGLSFLLPSNAGWDGSNTLDFYYCLVIPPPRTIIDENDRPALFTQLYLRAAFSLFSWQYLFSVRRNTMNGAQRFVAFANQCSKYEKDGWSLIYPLLQKAEEDYKKDARFSVIVVPYPGRLEGSILAFTACIPTFPILYQDQYRGYFSNLMLMRVTKVALALREYRLKNHKYPDPIDEFLSSNPDFYDLANNKPLCYIRNSANKSFRLYSVGLNLKDDKGESERNAFSWNQAKDDIGVDLQ